MKIEDNKNIKLLFFCIAFVLYTIPRSIDVIFPIVYDIVNILKILVTVITFITFLKKRIKVAPITIAVCVYFLYLLIVTIFNKLSPITVIKVYGLNVGILMLCELIFSSELKNKFVKIFSHYYLILLIVNLIFIIIAYILGNEEFKIFNTYFLGQDNRFILYIIPALIGFYYLNQVYNDKRNTIKLYITYLIGTITLLLLWSVASLCILLLIGLGYVALKNLKKFKLNIYYITIAVLGIDIALVFFKIQNYFSFIIVNILHKSLDLSYRTIIWDRAIDMLCNSKNNLFLGFGYFDTSKLFLDIQQDLNHLHNIILDPLFAGGIIGILIFMSMIFIINRNINKIINTVNANLITLVFAGILVLLLFDTYEMYQTYYFMIYLVCAISKIFNIIHRKYKKREDTNDNIIIQDKYKVGILLATYNGEKYLEEQINSIINQTYKNWILYISDDHSTDNTVNIILKYKKLYNDKIIIIDNENKYSSAKMNFINLFNKVDGLDYYMFCDQDDVWDKNKIMHLLTSVKYEEENNKVPILAYCDSKIVDKEMSVINNSFVEYSNKHLPEKNLMKHVLLENYFPGCAILFNKELKDKTETIYKDCEMHDWWLTLTAALLGKIIFVNEPLHNYRQHGNNTIGVHKNNGIIIKITNRIKKLFDLNKTKETWSNYQKTVLNQSEQLIKQYSKDSEINNENIANVEKFIKIMNEKNKLKRLILLTYNGYIPVEKIRVLRLVL